MASKSYEWAGNLLRVVLHDGPAKGSYDVYLHAGVIDGQGLITLGHRTLSIREGTSQRIAIRASDFPALAGEIQARLAAKEREITEARQTCECDRCHQEFPATEATFQPARIGARKINLPYCRPCAKLLWESDGFGDAAGSTEPADMTTLHKEQDQ
jgi:hypothetical protein